MRNLPAGQRRIPGAMRSGPCRTPRRAPRGLALTGRAVPRQRLLELDGLVCQDTPGLPPRSTNVHRTPRYRSDLQIGPQVSRYVRTRNVMRLPEGDCRGLVARSSDDDSIPVEHFNGCGVGVAAIGAEETEGSQGQQGRPRFMGPVWSSVGRPGETRMTARECRLQGLYRQAVTARYHPPISFTVVNGEEDRTARIVGVLYTASSQSRDCRVLSSGSRGDVSSPMSSEGNSARDEPSLARARRPRDLSSCGPKALMPTSPSPRSRENEEDRDERTKDQDRRPRTRHVAGHDDDDEQNGRQSAKHVRHLGFRRRWYEPIRHQRIMPQENNFRNRRMPVG